MKSRTGYGIYDKDADSLYSPYLYDEQYEAESVAYDYNRGHQQCTQVWNEDDNDYDGELPDKYIAVKVTIEPI